MGTNWAVPQDLAGLRTSKGITLQEIAKQTKISVRYLEAIESGRFKALPGGVYNISYIRQYAQAIGYEETTLLEHYYRVTGQSPTHEEEILADPPAARSSIWDLWSLLNVSGRKLRKI
jgi:cytoskeleton protein RodZ